MKKKQQRAGTTTSAPRLKTAVRFPDEVFGAADKIIQTLGVGDRTTIIRRAALYGLRSFLADPKLVGRAASIEL